ncbi:ATP-binding protein [Bacteriovoracales bacterium]|nr:ATP-binding protein [Bacteriovoracales bacterium]
MKSRIRKKLLFILIILIFTSCGQRYSGKVAPKAVNGVLDLSGWNFEKDGPVELKGDWKFYWKNLINPTVLVKGHIPQFDSLVNVPGRWDSGKKKFPKYGFGSFLLKVKGLDDKLTYFFDSPEVFTAYKMFIASKDGVRKIFNVGEVGKQKRFEHPRFSFEISKVDSLGDINLLVHVSNFYYRFGKINSPPRIGLQSQIKWFFEYNKYRDFFGIGVLFIMALYHLILFYQRKKDKSSLYFSLLCFNLFVRLMCTGYYINWAFDSSSPLIFILSTKLEYLSLSTFMTCGLFFLGEIFDNVFSRLKKVSLYVSLFFISIILFTPPNIFSQKIILMSIFSSIGIIFYVGIGLLLKLYLNKTKFSKEVLVSVLFMLMGFIHDMLVTPFNLLSPPMIGPLTMVIWVFFQCYILSIKFSNAFTKSETLSKDLHLMVESRTSQLKDANLNLENSNNALEEFHTQRNIFFANLSHELRTPLNAILGFSKILQKKLTETNKYEKEYVDSINTSGKSLLRMVNSVHDFSKIELNELKVIKQKCNLKEILNSVSLFFKNEAYYKGLNFQFTLPDDIPASIETDELALKQILDNILNNALKFTKNGYISLEIKAIFKGYSENKFDLYIHIADTGQGMKEEKLAQLFQPFSQIHKHGTIQERGSGLGLYISQKIINDLGGDIQVTSKVGKGSVFTISLKDTTFFNEETESRNFSYKFFGDTILIADDVPINIKLYEAYFSMHNLKIESAQNGSELLKKVKEVRPDLIVTDFEMPEFNADEVLTILRTKNINTPVVLISALKVEEGIKKEFQSFLQKPVDEEDFLNEIARHLKHEKVFINEIAKVGPSYAFSLPKNLSKEDLKLILETHATIKKWRNSMEITNMEKEIPFFKEKLMHTKLNVLLVLLDKVEESAVKFNISKIESLLDYAIEKLKNQD